MDKRAKLDLRLTKDLTMAHKGRERKRLIHFNSFLENNKNLFLEKETIVSWNLYCKYYLQGIEQQQLCTGRIWVLGEGPFIR